MEPHQELFRLAPQRPEDGSEAKDRDGCRETTGEQLEDRRILRRVRTDMKSIAATALAIFLLALVGGLIGWGLKGWAWAFWKVLKNIPWPWEGN